MENHASGVFVPTVVFVIQCSCLSLSMGCWSSPRDPTSYSVGCCLALPNPVPANIRYNVRNIVQHPTGKSQNGQNTEILRALNIRFHGMFRTPNIPHQPPTSQHPTLAEDMNNSVNKSFRLAFRASFLLLPVKAARGGRSGVSQL